MPLFNPRTTGFLKHFMEAYPGRSALMVALLAFAGLVEGVGVVTMLPLLELVTAGDAAEGSRLSSAVETTLGTVGLEPTLGILLGLIVIMMVAKAIFLWFAMRQVGYTVAQVTTDLRMSLLRALLRARWGYYASRSTGGLANAISNEAYRAASAYRSGCVMIAGFLQILFYLAVALLISWPMAIGTIVIGAVFIFLLRGFVRMSRDAGHQETVLMKSLIGRLTDALRGIKPIRAMGKEAHLQPLLEAEAEGLNQALRRQVSAGEGLRLFQEPTLVIMLALGLYFALGVAGFPFASVMVLAFIFYRLMGQANQLQAYYGTLATGESAFWSIMEQIDEAEAQREQVTGTRPPPTDLVTGIRLVDVWFGYDDVPVLRGLNLEIPVGSFVALHGPSGAGKTTVADLIIGFHQSDSGVVEVDGVPLTELDLIAWRRRVGYVPQEVFLFHDTIFRNVTLGDPSLTRGEVEDALRSAGAWTFVNERADGVDAMIGEAGAKLSGGQRQRIAIARALVHRPRLLILDEATAALDPLTEAEILQTIQGLSGGVTILAISHQPALRDAAQFVYSLRNGMISGSARGV